MKILREADMAGGWFVGDFSPTALRTAEVEVAVKRYDAGASEPAHVHRIATEITMVVSGEVEMGGTTITEGSIVVLSPGEATGFKAVTDATTVVVKLPSVPGDKYLV